MRYVHTFTDRLGKTRYYFRRGAVRYPLPSPDSADFENAYLAAKSGAPVPINRTAARVRSNPARVARKPDAGVYLLLLKNRVVYVGSSVDMTARVMAHRHNGRPFDRAYYIPAPDDERLDLEAALIAAIKPPQNRSGIERRTGIGNPPERRRQNGS